MTPVEGHEWLPVPAALTSLDRWVCWRLEPASEPGGTPRKVPIDARTGRRASTTDPKTWAAFEDATGRCGSDRTLSGVGFVFADEDGLVGVDIDGCVIDGAVAPGAQAIIDALASYAETSPSGTGVKVFLRASKGAIRNCKSRAVAGVEQVEVYSHSRYFTVTGQHLAGTPLDVNERQGALDSLCKRLWPRKPKRTRGSAPTDGVQDDDALIEQARNARNGAKFSALWSGDTSLHAGDDSAADAALCSMLAFWTGRDAARIDRLFRRSGLMRDKWDERRGDGSYGALTVEHAIANCTETHSPPRGRARRAPSQVSTDVETEAGDTKLAADRGADQPFPLGTRDSETGRLILSPTKTLPTARAYLDEHHTHADGRTLIAYGGMFLEWRNNCYRELEEAAVCKALHAWLHESLRTKSLPDGGETLVPFDSNPTTVSAALKTIRAESFVPASRSVPCWLDGGVGRPSPHDVLACLSINLNVATGEPLPATPLLITMTALDFDYDAAAPEPKEFLAFLDSILADDSEAIGTLQEWFGLMLVADTRYHKILLLLGPPRSGKGTLMRVLSALVGHANVANPTSASLAGHFGLQSLIGKSLAIIGDARFSGPGTSAVVERLLTISGEDSVSIDRKHVTALNMKLPTRFVIVTNELPRLADASGALARRFVVVRLTRTFLGNEDLSLTERLLAERPGILLWALEGLRRLRARGRFVQPASAADAANDLVDLASPVHAFVQERCVVASDVRATLADLFAEWRDWCAERGIVSVGSDALLARGLQAAVVGIRSRRTTGQKRFYEGIALRSAM
ncbi:MAG: hypothetical protein JNM94_15390 [Phycisphaerae bacterium]|nr:hypothetical protein [Phycisphaerae bacterium]